MGSRNQTESGDYIRRTIELPRPTKRIISIGTDGVMISLALWAAISLKAGRPQLRLDDSLAYALVLSVSIPTFVRFGLYRAVIRFLGHKAIFAAAFAVVLSGVLLGFLGLALRLPALSPSVVTIYSCLVLLYVAGSRFVVHYYLLTRHVQPTVARVAIYGAGEAGARLSDRAFDHARVRSAGIHR